VPSPGIFHLANLTVHVLNVLLVFAILRRLVRSDWACCAGALLFGLHPVQVEPVAWVTGMKDLLGGLFCLAALWSYLSYATLVRDAPGAVGGRWRYAVATACFVLALLSKPSAVALPVIAWILDRWALKRPAGEVTVATIPWVVLALPFIALTRWAEQGPGPLPPGPPIWVRPLVAGDALAFYLCKLAVPVRLGPDYGRTPAFVLQHTWGYLTWLVPAGLAALIWLRRGSRPLLAPAALVFVAGLLPVLGLAPFTFQGYSTVADRYLYLAMLGPALALASLSSRIKLTWLAAIWVPVLAYWGLQSAFQVPHWHDSVALFDHALAVNPRSWMAHNKLGLACAERGDLDQAIEHYREALRIDPNLPGVYNNLAIAFARQGKRTAAITHWQEALRLAPDYAEVHYNLARLYAEMGRTEQARQAMARALRLAPELARAPLPGQEVAPESTAPSPGGRP
jgi:hypothetical protein